MPRLRRGARPAVAPSLFAAGRSPVVHAAAALLLAACGAGKEFRQARHYESVGRAADAIAAFTRFAERHPKDARAPEALVRAGRLYARVLGRCPEGRPLLERAAREYPDSQPWARRAAEALLDCPEYFPLRHGMSWTYVDPESGGQILRRELKAIALDAAASPGAGLAPAPGPGSAPAAPPSTGSAVALSTAAPAAAPDPFEEGRRAELRGAEFAGPRRVRDLRYGYVKQDWAVWEVLGGRAVRIIKYPYQPGTTWTGWRLGAAQEFTIDSTSETVSVFGGVFHDCLRVRMAQPGAAAWVNEYYAPGVGLVKATNASSGVETTVYELRSWRVPGEGPRGAQPGGTR